MRNEDVLSACLLSMAIQTLLIALTKPTTEELILGTFLLLVSIALVRFLLSVKP